MLHCNYACRGTFQKRPPQGEHQMPFVLALNSVKDFGHARLSQQLISIPSSEK